MTSTYTLSGTTREGELVAVETTVVLWKALEIKRGWEAAGLTVEIEEPKA